MSPSLEPVSGAPQSKPPAKRQSPGNAEIADVLYRLAELYELQQDEVFRILAYRRAAGTIRRWPEPISAMAARGEDIAALPTIGETIAGQILEICKTGRLKGLEEAERRTPPEVRSLSKLPGLGPTRLRRLADYLAIHSVDALREAVERRQVREVPGFGPVIEARLREALAQPREPGPAGR